MVAGVKEMVWQLGKKFDSFLFKHKLRKPSRNFTPRYLFKRNKVHIYKKICVEIITAALFVKAWRTTQIFIYNKMSKYI